MLEPETAPSNERSILDYLNKGQWRAVLRYVPVQDIVQSERVSRRWQRAILGYLQEVRFSFTPEEEVDGKIRANSFTWKLSESKYESFERWTNKLGSTVVAAYSKNRETLKTVRENCPNLEALTLIDFEESESTSDKIDIQLYLKEDFKCLKQIFFNKSCYISDQIVNQFIAANKALEELEFYHCCKITGQCFNSENVSNLQSLIIDKCLDLQASHILSSADHLKELTKLQLIDVLKDISTEIQLVLDKMPKLEWLEIHNHVGARNRSYLVNFEPICRLSNLKHLSTDLKVTNESVDAITRCCQNLETLELMDCAALTPEGLAAISRNAGDHLIKLGLYYFSTLEDVEVLDCIRCCPKLRYLAVGGTCFVTLALPALASAARQETSPGVDICVDISDINLCVIDPHYCPENLYNLFEDLYLSD